MASLVLEGDEPLTESFDFSPSLKEHTVMWCKAATASVQGEVTIRAHAWKHLAFETIEELNRWVTEARALHEKEELFITAIAYWDC
eukprot:6013931-Amphidinium_carterae.1